jgi:hypothetical protein
MHTISHLKICFKTFSRGGLIIVLSRAATVCLILFTDSRIYIMREHVSCQSIPQNWAKKMHTIMYFYQFYRRQNNWILNPDDTPRVIQYTTHINGGLWVHECVCAYIHHRLLYTPYHNHLSIRSSWRGLDWWLEVLWLEVVAGVLAWSNTYHIKNWLSFVRYYSISQCVVKILTSLRRDDSLV